MAKAASGGKKKRKSTTTAVRSNLLRAAQEDGGGGGIVIPPPPPLPPKEDKGGGYVPEEKEDKGGGYVPEIPEPGEPSVPEPPVTGGSVRAAPFALAGAAWTTQQAGGPGTTLTRAQQAEADRWTAQAEAYRSGTYVPYTAPTAGGITVGRYVDEYGRPTAAGAGGRAPTGAPAMGGVMMAGGRVVGGRGLGAAEYPAHFVEGEPRRGRGGGGYPAAGYMAPEVQPHMPQPGQYSAIVAEGIAQQLEDAAEAIGLLRGQAAWAARLTAESIRRYGVWPFMMSPTVALFMGVSEHDRQLRYDAEAPYHILEAGAPWWKATKQAKTYKGGGYAPSYGGYGGGGGYGYGGGYGDYERGFSLGLVNWRIGG